jgi:hypothetical protein
MPRKSKWRRFAVVGQIHDKLHLQRTADLGPCGEGVVDYTCRHHKSFRDRRGQVRQASCTNGLLVFRDPASGRRIKSKLPVVRYEGHDRTKKRAMDWVTRIAMQHGDDGLARLRRLCGARPKKGWRRTL